MPYRFIEDQRVELDGSITGLLKDFSTWYKEDALSCDHAPYDRFVKFLLIFYTSFARKKWEKSMFGESKIKVLNTLFTTTSSGMDIDIYEVADLLAETISESERKAWAPECRRKTVDFIMGRDIV